VKLVLAEEMPVCVWSVPSKFIHFLSAGQHLLLGLSDSMRKLRTFAAVARPSLGNFHDSSSLAKNPLKHLRA